MTAVAVTGLGLVAPHGDDPALVFEAVLRGMSAVRPVFPELARPAAAATAAFDVSRWFTKLQLPGIDRVSQLAVAAADLAVRDAALGDDIDPARLGVYVGCGMGGAAALQAAYEGGARNGRVPPLTIPAFMPNAAASQVALRQRAHGPVLTYAIACASSGVAVSEAARAVERGDVDVAIAGGAEALIVPGIVMAWQAMQTLATFAPAEEATACRPFDRRRSGFVLGEGAAFLILESDARARGRSARRYARLTGCGLSNDATHLTKPDAPGQARALRQALADAGLGPADVGYCNAHGTATRIGDAVEALALADVWGPHLHRLRVSSTKALHGHLLGATGALEALLTVLALHRRQLPPNAHCEEPDPECTLHLVSAGGEEAPALHAAISNSFAFGGTNSVLLFERA